ncbi:MAG TPA: aminoacetone oxidase family FAD-binding enzyme [Acidobacteriota bacterium]|nr:aminoacetone oxidase family FAD-binding enzyme [Acidobacteriota bacterium]
MTGRHDLAVVGAGAAGLTAATSAARRGASVALLERLSRAGKKLLATGGGRCNLLNDGLSPAAFTSTDRGVVASVLERFGAKEIRDFFGSLGLRLVTDEAGRVYPATNQAASVLKVLELAVRRSGVRVETGFEVNRIMASPAGFSLGSSDGREIAAEAVVLAGGGRSYPALGSNGSCYELAASFGHRIVAPVPSAVPILVKDRMCHFLQGQRLRATVSSRIDGKPGAKAEGELLFTQYGLSGTAVLDASEGISVALNREEKRDVAVVVDLVPFVAEPELAREIERRLEKGWPAEDLGVGLLPEKFALVVPGLLREAGEGRGSPSDTAGRLAAALKAKEFRVHGTRGWNEAEFTSGGVDAREVLPRTLGSKLQKGLYLAGEVLDVQGGRGGFNLAWAWASGFVAGLTE